MAILKRRYYSVAISNRENNETDPRGHKFRVLNNGNGFWVADPFPVEHDDKLYIFGEMYEFRTLKGSICYAEILPSNGNIEWHKIIEEDYHLSFPNVFEIDGTFYMCPESHNARNLTVYKCMRFPDKWEKIKNFAQGKDYSDTIFIKRDNQIYGFTCIWKSLHEHRFCVFKLSNDNVEETSEPDMKTLEYYLTRPAGKILNEGIEGKEIMVSQICKPQYGSGLIFKTFDLSWPCYKETELFRCYPKNIKVSSKDNYDGIHTFNLTESYMVIDLLQTRINFKESMYRLFRKIMNSRTK